MASRPPPDFSAFIAGLARRLRGRSLPFMLIGGQAVLLHGRPRLTEDIDVTLGTGPNSWPIVREICDELERWAREFAAVPGREGMTPAIDRLRRESQS